MSLFKDIISSKIRELEEFKQSLLIDVETRLRREADTVLNKFSSHITEVESEVMLEKERLLFNAVIESRKKVAETYENILKDFQQSIYDTIEKIRGDERYIKFLSSLLQSSANYIQSRDVVIYVSPRDRGVVETLAKSQGLNALVKESDIRGGVIVASRDGAVVVDYSLETLIKNKIDELKHLLYLTTYER